MNKLPFLISCIAIFSFTVSFLPDSGPGAYGEEYHQKIVAFDYQQQELLAVVAHADLNSKADIAAIKGSLARTRSALKQVDFWIRYLEPIAYKKINAPLPVEWETEVFEKFEMPYKREGAGLTLAELYLETGDLRKDTLLSLLSKAKAATQVFLADSITTQLQSYHHFYLCNRLFLLNLAAIYTTGFECPNSGNILPELKTMLLGAQELYKAYNQSFPGQPLLPEYLMQFNGTIAFVDQQPKDIEQFDHFQFIQKYINPLFSLNQEMIRANGVVSGSYNDYSLSNSSKSIFDKSLFQGQNPKGVYYAIQDPVVLEEIKKTGKLLFYDPILSSNNRRSCASCHKPTQYFTDTLQSSALQFDERQHLPRNTPSLINVVYNHLLNLDGKHFNLQNQARDVITNPQEMAAGADEVVKKVLSSSEYRSAFKKFASLTPYTKKISIDHITSAITLYYAELSDYYSPFDEAMTGNATLPHEVKEGFNLFMGRARCGTCHFVPHFNGVKPPYTGTEFEVIGVPQDADFKEISRDNGRYNIHPAPEMKNAFRTGTVRNAARTKPYMHNGSFETLDEVIDFYNNGGGSGRGLMMRNQTLPPDSLKLSALERKKLLAFIYSLNEAIPDQLPPKTLPQSTIKNLNARQPGGEY